MKWLNSEDIIDFGAGWFGGLEPCPHNFDLLLVPLVRWPSFDRGPDGSHGVYHGLTAMVNLKTPLELVSLHPMAGPWVPMLLYSIL